MLSPLDRRRLFRIASGVTNAERDARWAALHELRTDDDAKLRRKARSLRHKKRR